MTIQIRLLFLVCLVAAPLAAGGAAQAGVCRQGEEMACAHEVARRLAESSEPVAVIVRLYADNPPLKRSIADLHEQSERVVRAVESFVRTIGPDAGVRDIRSMRLQPTFAAVVDREGLDRLLMSPQVLDVELDDAWELHTAEGMEMIQAASMQSFGFTGSGMAVGIIDTGIDALHPTLGSGTIPNAKVVRGLDTADLDDDPTDCSGHGTAVASIAAGLSYQWSPDRYFAGGVAPAANIFAYKAAPDADCTVLIESSVIAAIEDAILNRTTDEYELVALNISGGAGAWDGPCDDAHPAIAQAVQQATDLGIAVIASTGNNGLSNGIAAPACLKNVISVGSVWDENASEIGSLFCLDFQCQHVCSDGSKMKGEVTCYTNTGRMLDLLAPSEYLRVAQANGLTTSFGGTSGAAPYLTGAIALIRKARPEIPAENLRTLLATTGALVTEPRSALTRPVIRLIDALDSTHVTPAPDTSVDIPGAAEGPLYSELQLSGAGAVGGVRVWLRLSHPNLAELDIRLASPEGTQVVLHGPDSPQATTGSGGLFGTYPIDLTPLENLGAFVGEERLGTWTLIIKNLEPSTESVGTLDAWGLILLDLEEPPAPPPLGTARIPIAARGPGAAGTYWTSNLRIYNPAGSTPADIRLFLTREGVSGAARLEQRPLLIPAGHTVELDDVVGTFFTLDTAAGPILLDSGDAPLIAASRISTRTDSNGSYGQFVPSRSRPAAHNSVLLQLTGGTEFRSNLGITELDGEPATATVTMYDAESGDPLGTPLQLDVDSFSTRRVQRIVERFGAPSHRAYAVVQTDNAVLPWASVVDERTGDAIFVPATPLDIRPFQTIPVVARSPGVGGTVWRSDVQLLGFGSESSSLLLELRLTGDPDGEVLSRELMLEPGRVVVLEDVLLEVFGIDQGVGSLRLVSNSPSTPFLADSRTFNRTNAGTYGQRIAAVTEGLTGQSTIVAVDGADGIRSNLILCEVSGHSLWIEASLSDSINHKLGSSVTVHLEPHRAVQINDVFASFGAAPERNCRIDLRPLTGEGSYAALVSAIDQETGDAIAVPATPVP